MEKYLWYVQGDLYVIGTDADIGARMTEPQKAWEEEQIACGVSSEELDQSVSNYSFVFWPDTLIKIQSESKTAKEWACSSELGFLASQGEWDIQDVLDKEEKE